MKLPKSVSELLVFASDFVLSDGQPYVTRVQSSVHTRVECIPSNLLQFKVYEDMRYTSRMQSSVYSRMQSSVRPSNRNTCLTLDSTKGANNTVC